MAITSKNNRVFPRHGNTQFRYSVIYVLITFLVLLFLNIYTSRTSQKLFYQSKEASMVEKCLMVASDVEQLDAWNYSTISEAIAKIGSLRMSRTVVTDQAGIVIYDSAETLTGQLVLFPEIVEALKGNDVFSWQYAGGVMRSQVATPMYSFDGIMGCVYLMEYDAQQGALMQSLQQNILTITLILELVVIAFSFAFSRAFGKRLRKIMVSMRIIREGDYSHRVDMGGNDELTVLGEEFNDLTDRLQSSENRRRQFVSDASHELKTPLASIKLLTDSILQNEMDMDTIREFVGDIGREADRLNRMSQKLLTLSRIESQEDGCCEIVYMSPTLKRVVRMLKGQAAAGNIQVQMELEQDCPILVLEDDLYQIAFNLTENGIKYNTPGGSLTISIQRQEDTAVLRFADTGVGIPEDSLENIFERFYRVDKARSRKSGGSGLGLSIVKNMVERNGGTIRVESTVGQGSVFIVTFPIFDTEVDPE